MNVIKETKTISARLRPPTLDELGLLPTIRWYTNEFSRLYPGLEICVSFNVKEEEIPERFKIAIYRILQEAIHNTAKHSRGDRVSISLSRENDKIRLLIEDNGRGFDTSVIQSQDDSLSGCGIRNMQERAEICGGTFRLSSPTGEGTRIEVLLPLKSE
jgi:signal transduction histidine kinase